MFYDVQEILHQSFLTVLDSHVIDLIIEPKQKIDCRSNLRKIDRLVSQIVLIYMCLLISCIWKIVHLCEVRGGGTQIWGETTEFFVPLLKPCSDMMNPFLLSSKFGSPSSLRRAENSLDNCVFSISLNWIPYSNLCETTYLTDSYHFELNPKLFILSCHTCLMPIQPVHLLTSTKTSHLLLVKHNSTYH